MSWLVRFYQGTLCKSQPRK